MPDAKMLQEISNWPQLKITYRTDPEKIAALLPPGIDPNSEPHVHLSIYNVPILGEPEYGIVTKIKADYRGTPGWYTIGYAIDQEAAVFISQELNGQPKYPAEIHYYRIGDAIEARGIHQGYTFVEFKGEVKEDLPNDEPYEMNEWWIKSVRAVNGAEKAYDFPPHVVHVKGVSGTTSKQRVEGELTLRDSPWDPFTELLPQRELVEATLECPKHVSRDITLAGKLDPEAFWPHADVISGSRWPGHRGGPRR